MNPSSQRGTGRLRTQRHESMAGILVAKRPRKRQGRQEGEEFSRMVKELPQRALHSPFVHSNLYRISNFKFQILSILPNPRHPCSVRPSPPFIRAFPHSNLFRISNFGFRISNPLDPPKSASSVFRSPVPAFHSSLPSFEFVSHSSKIVSSIESALHYFIVAIFPQYSPKRLSPPSVRA